MKSSLSVLPVVLLTPCLQLFLTQSRARFLLEGLQFHISHSGHDPSRGDFGGSVRWGEGVASWGSSVCRQACPSRTRRPVACVRDGLMHWLCFWALDSSPQSVCLSLANHHGLDSCCTGTLPTLLFVKIVLVTPCP